MRGREKIIGENVKMPRCAFFFKEKRASFLKSNSLKNNPNAFKVSQFHLFLTILKFDFYIEAHTIKYTDITALYITQNVQLVEF